MQHENEMHRHCDKLQYLKLDMFTEFLVIQFAVQALDGFRTGMK